MRIIVILLIVNLIGAGFVLAEVVYARFRHDIRGTNQITQLDRAGVLDQSRLAEQFPSLAVDTRNTLAHWITDPAQHVILRVSFASFVLALSNILLLIAYAARFSSIRRA